VTIDFGDGRKLERTLTGNSIHYVLANDGTVVDALPGLYSPNRFLVWIHGSHTITKGIHQFTGPKEQIAEYLQNHHAEKALDITRVWRGELDAIEAAKLEAQNNQGQANQANPPAALATRRAVPKAILELPILANIIRDARALELQTPNDTWEQIASRHLDKAKLDHKSLELIRSENPVVPTGENAGSADRDDAFKRLVAAFEKAIAQDTVRNEYLLHFKIHEWFANGTAPMDLETLNEKVYAELFLTPKADPWIGLVPPDAYTGLENGGAVLPQ
jgi:hypothetical protein